MAESPAMKERHGSVSELFNIQSNIEIQIFLCFLSIARESYLYWQLFSSQRKSRKNKFHRDQRKEGKKTQKIETLGRKKAGKANKTPVKY